MGHYDDVCEEKDKGGRPLTILSGDQLSKVEALSSVLTTEQIADYFGMGRTTFYEVMKRQPEVSECYKKGRAKAISDIASSLLIKAQSGDNAAMMFYLKTQAGWRENAPIEEKDDSHSNITINLVDAKKPE
jgi:predicted RNA binding protein with dsRBD fold (UPF0201 family)